GHARPPSRARARRRGGRPSRRPRPVRTRPQCRRGGAVMGVVAAERIKITSTRSPWWCAALVLALGLGIAVLMAALSHNTEATQGADAFTLTATTATGGVSGFGVMVVRSEERRVGEGGRAGRA